MLKKLRVVDSVLQGVKPDCKADSMDNSFHAIDSRKSGNDVDQRGAEAYV